MRTEAQIEASRINGAKSKGPKTAEGKDVSKFNGLKHGLRAKDVVLPNEDPAAFREFLDAWMADWNPPTMTRRHLVEAAASAAWRQRRCMRVETDRLSDRMLAAFAEWDAAEDRDVALAAEGLADEPAEALAALESTRAGVDLLHGLWGVILEAASEPGGWVDVEAHHDTFVSLLGMAPDEEPAEGEDHATYLASWLLTLRDRPDLERHGYEPHGDEAAALVRAQIASMARSHRARLEALYARRPDRSAERASFAERRAFEPRPEDAPLLRYEAQMGRQFHKSLADLMKLAKTGADLEAPSEPEAAAPSEPGASPAPSEPRAAAPSEPRAAAPSEPRAQVPASPAPSEPRADAPPAPLIRSDRDRGGRTWAVGASPDA